MSTDGLHVVMLEAQPLPGCEDFGEVGGAFIRVYTTAPTPDEAVAIANAEIADAGWTVLYVEETYWLDREEASGSEESLAYFEQALQNGILLLFHNYPPDDAEGDPPDVLH